MQTTEKRNGIKPWRLVRAMPNKVGHYWFRVDEQHELSMVEVFIDDVDNWCIRRSSMPVVDDTDFLANNVGEYAGPMPRPRNEYESL